MNYLVKQTFGNVVLTGCYYEFDLLQSTFI